MAFKLNVTEDEYQALPEPVKVEYTKTGDTYRIQVDGMKTQEDIDRLNGALVKERGDHKAVRDRLGLLGDRKIEDVLVQLDRIPELEAAAGGKLDDNAINAIVEKRITTRLAPIERERDALKGTLGEREQEIGGYKAERTQRTIHDAVRKAAVDGKLLPEAVDDALLYADRVFEIDDTGKVVTKDGVGVTPGLQPSVWLTDMQRTRPHWWGESRGGGAGGTRQLGGGGDNPWSHEKWNMTEQGRIVNSDPAKAEQLAKAAGTTVGGLRPAPRK